MLTESGLGVAQNQLRAAQWYILAAQGGDKEAIRRRDVLRAQMSKLDLTAAEAFANDWKPDVPDKLANDASFAGQAWKNRQPDAQPANG